MKIFLLGATGRVGGRFLHFALRDGHHVTALVRNPERVNTPHPNLTIRQGDARRQENIAQALKGAEIVVSALSTDGTTTLTDSIRFIIKAMTEENVKRIITVGTAGILQSRTDPSLLRYQSNESKRSSTFAAEEHHQVYNLLAQTELLWTIVCPTALKEQTRPQPVRALRDYLPENGTSVSFSDTAAFVYKQIYDHEYVRARVGIAY
jgi:putative NADH-flavin reductase